MSKDDPYFQKKYWKLINRKDLVWTVVVMVVALIIGLIRVKELSQLIFTLTLWLFFWGGGIWTLYDVARMREKLGLDKR